MLHTVLHLPNYPSETEIIPSSTEHHAFCKGNESTVFTASIHGQSFFDMPISAPSAEVSILFFPSCLVPPTCGPSPFILLQQKATSSSCLLQQSTHRWIIFNYNYGPATCYKRVNEVQGQSENFPFPSLVTHRRSWWPWFSWKAWFAPSPLETRNYKRHF